MSVYSARRASQRAYDKGSKDLLYTELKKTEPKTLIELIWEYMSEAESSYAELKTLRTKIEALNNKSGQRVRCMDVLPNRRALVKLGPVTEELLISPSVDVSKLTPGCEVLVVGGSDGRMVAEIRDPFLTEGRFSKVARKIDDKRFVLEDGGHQLIMRTIDGVECDVGDEVRYDLDSLLILETLSHKEDSSFTLGETPTVCFDDVKGIDDEKRYLMERIVYPAVYKERFQEYGLSTIRGAVLHGPPGTGKTMLAAAIFNEMAKLKKVNDSKGFFVVNGPEVLNKWAGQTEETIRKLFKEARKVAEQSGLPSVIFWDEIESIASRRKDSATYTPEKTVVPTLLAELQGVKDAGSIILIGATNRADLLDPALMRPGRLGDAVLEIPRPDRDGALAIVQSNVERNKVPQGLQPLLEGGLVEKLVAYVYDNPKPLVRAKLKSGEIIGLMRQEMVNGALFAQVGEELIRNACMAEIYNSEPPTEQDAIQMIDNILLNQTGVLDSGTKNGFNFNTSDLVIDVSLNG
jgi:proteasome-associated ATPase